MTDHYFNIPSAPLIKAPRSTHPAVRRLKRKTKARSAHGNKVWASTHVLIDFLQANPIDSNLRILELGAGWGVLSAYLAKTFRAQVVALDLDPDVVGYSELVAGLNETEFDTVTMDFSALTVEQLANFDLVIAADVCFWDYMPEVLSELLLRCEEGEVSRVIFADPGRPPFYELARWCQTEYDAAVYPWHVSQSASRGYILDID